MADLSNLRRPEGSHRDTKRLARLRGRVEQLRGTWADLDDGAFRESGTGVRTGLLRVTAPAASR